MPARCPALASAAAPSHSPSPWGSPPGPRRDGSPIGAGAGRAGPRSRRRVRTWWRSSLSAAAVVAAAAAQAPNYRVTYRLRVVGRVGSDTGVLATGIVSGPPETKLRLSLRASGAELWGLLETLPEPDTVGLAALFFGRRQAGRSRRGLPVWEEDSYRRWSRLPWAARRACIPSGPPDAARRPAPRPARCGSRSRSAMSSRPARRGPAKR